MIKNLIEKLKTDRVLAVSLATLALGLFLIGYLGIRSFNDTNLPVENILITNVTDSAFTVVWTSDKPYLGKLVYKEASKEWSGLFPFNNSQIAYDTRDIKINNNGKYELSLTEQSNGRYTHHVTISDLEPETSYSFRIAGEFNVTTPDKIGSVTTQPIAEDIFTPDPAYGSVVGEFTKEDTVIVFFPEIINEDGINVASATLANNATYSFDINQIKDDKIASQVLTESDRISTVIYSGDKSYKVGLTQASYKPFPNVVLGIPQAERGVGNSALVSGIFAQETGENSEEDSTDPAEPQITDPYQNCISATQIQTVRVSGIDTILNVRTEPSLNGTRVGSLTNGQQLEIAPITENPTNTLTDHCRSEGTSPVISDRSDRVMTSRAWYRVKATDGSIEGWVSAVYITINDIELEGDTANGSQGTTDTPDDAEVNEITIEPVATGNSVNLSSCESSTPEFVSVSGTEGSNLLVREGPGTNFTVVERLAPSSDIAQVLGCETDSQSRVWYSIKIIKYSDFNDEQFGYAASWYLTGADYDPTSEDNQAANSVVTDASTEVPEIGQEGPNLYCMTTPTGDIYTVDYDTPTRASLTTAIDGISFTEGSCEQEDAQVGTTGNNEPLINMGIAICHGYDPQTNIRDSAIPNWQNYINPLLENETLMKAVVDSEDCSFDDILTLEEYFGEILSAINQVNVAIMPEPQNNVGNWQYENILASINIEAGVNVSNNTGSYSIVNICTYNNTENTQEAIINDYGEDSLEQINQIFAESDTYNYAYIAEKNFILFNSQNCTTSYNFNEIETTCRVFPQASNGFIGIDEEILADVDPTINYNWPAGVCGEEDDQEEVDVDDTQQYRIIRIIANTNPGLCNSFLGNQSQIIESSSGTIIIAEDNFPLDYNSTITNENQTYIITDPNDTNFCSLDNIDIIRQRCNSVKYSENVGYTDPIATDAQSFDPTSCQVDSNEDERAMLSRYKSILAQQTPASRGAIQQLSGEAKSTGDNQTTDTLQATESGRYVFFRDGERVAERDIIVDGDSVNVRFFTDTNGNGRRDSGEEFIADASQFSLAKEATLETYQLNSGWNAISLPLFDTRENNPVQSAAALAEYWNNQGASVTQIAKFEGGKFITFSFRELEHQYSNNFDLVPGQGLFVFNVGGNREVSYSGRAYVEPVAIDLNSGWNFVGLINPEANYDTEALFNKLDQSSVNANIISQFENGNYQSVVSEDGLIFGNNYPILDKRGYFVRVEDGAQTFTP